MNASIHIKAVTAGFPQEGAFFNRLFQDKPTKIRKVIDVKKWTPWTIALAAACVAVAVTLWRQFDWTERSYISFVADTAGEAMMMLVEDPLAMRPQTQQAVRITAAAASAGHYVTPESEYALALQYQREGNSKEAKALLWRIVEESPSWSWPYALLGSMLGRDGPEYLEQAESLLRQAIALDPDWARPHNSLAVALRLLGRYEEAEMSALRALELAPDDIAAHNNYANLLLVLGRHEEAEAHYAYAVELEPDNPKPLYNLACLYSVMERDNDALTFLAAAIELNEGMRRDAAVDPYFDGLHLLPSFQALVYDNAAAPEEAAPVGKEEDASLTDEGA